MGFFSGRVTCLRFHVQGHRPGLFGQQHLDRLTTHAIGKARMMSGDGIEVGWTAGDHILDLSFELAKNIVNEALHFALRVDQQKIPSDLLKAYTQVELQALAAGNPSGRASAGQRKRARQSALERLESEARDGRFLKRKAFPILWDGPSNELLVGTTSPSVVDRLHTLFKHTFNHGIEPLTAGRQAHRLAQPRQQSRAVDDAALSPFVPAQAAAQAAWLTDEANRDFLGNEFLLWLWFQLDGDRDTITLGDGSQLAIMLTRTLVLECPRGQSGKETIASDAPTRLPEARRAIQSGKLPRRLGMILVRHDQQYELTFQGETLALGGARLPAPEAVEERARLEERGTQLRHLLETLDLLFDRFVQSRATDAWTKELARMQKWLQRDDHGRAA